MIDIFSNKEAFLRKEPKIGWIMIIISISILIIILIYISSWQIYDHYQTKGIVTCERTCTITMNVPTEISFDQIALNNEYLDYEVVGKELKIDEDYFTTYYEYTLQTSMSLSTNEIVDLNIYYNKQRIITKIKNKMF